jgi:hypothetical protein
MLKLSSFVLMPTGTSRSTATTATSCSGHYSPHAIAYALPAAPPHLHNPMHQGFVRTARMHDACLKEQTSTLSTRWHAGHAVPMQAAGYRSAETHGRISSSSSSSSDDIMYNTRSCCGPKPTRHDVHPLPARPCNAPTHCWPNHHHCHSSSGRTVASKPTFYHRWSPPAAVTTQPEQRCHVHLLVTG